MSYFITTCDPMRRQRWLALFGTDKLPVFAPVPRWQPVWQHGQVRDVPAYDLNIQALIDQQGQAALDRYASWLAGRNQRRYVEVRDELMAALSVPIKAINCEVVTVERPSPLFVWRELPRRLFLSHAA